jgi:outer membrane biosynthesis protein TonB
MTRALALIACAVPFLLSHTAIAKPKVALTQIEGDASGDVRDAVAEALEGKELALIGSREVNRAVDKIGDLADLTEKDFKKLATDLEADAIIAGKLDKVGTARTLKFRLFVHKKMAKGFTVSFKDPKSEKFRAALHDKMIDKIGLSGGSEEEESDAKPAKKKKAAEDEEDPLATKGSKKAKKGAKAEKLAEEDAEERPAKKTKGGKAEKAAEAEAEEPRPAKKAKVAEAEAEERPAKKAKAAESEAEAEAPRPAKKAKADDEAAPAGDDDKKQADDDDAPRKAKKQVASSDDGDELEATASAEPAGSARSANRAAIRVDIGGSVIQRSFKFNSAQISNKPKNVTLKPVAGARLDGEIYPLELTGSRGFAANLGLGFEYDKTISLNLVANNPNAMMSYNVPAKQSHYLLDVRYRHAFGTTETSPTLTVAFGYGKRLFSTDRSKVTADPVANASVLRDTPETNYTVIAPGLTFRMPVTRMVAFSIGGHAMVIPAAGPIQGANSYGKARVYGGDAQVAVDVIITKRIGLRIAGEFAQIGFEFLNAGALSNNLDGDPASQDVGGLADRALGGSATIAVLY